MALGVDVVVGGAVVAAEGLDLDPLAAEDRLRSSVQSEELPKVL